MIAAHLCITDNGATLIEADHYRKDWYGPAWPSERHRQLYQIAAYSTDEGYDLALDKPRHPQHVIFCSGWRQLCAMWLEASGGVELEVGV